MPDRNTMEKRGRYSPLIFNSSLCGGKARDGHAEGGAAHIAVSYTHLGVDLPLHLIYGLEQLFQALGGQVLRLNGDYDPVGQNWNRKKTGDSKTERYFPFITEALKTIWGFGSL